MKRSFVLVFVAMMLFCVVASGGCGGSSSSSGSPNNQTEGDFNSLSGGNTVSNGSGTATGPDGNFELRLNAERTASEGGVSFSNIQNAEVVQITEDTVNVTMNYKIYWDMYQNGSYVRTEQMSGPLAERGTYSFRRTNNRTWQLVSDRSTRSMTMDFTSNSSARVTETRDDWQVGSNTYQCQVSYTIANQNSSTTYDLSVLEGYWTASNGSGTIREIAGSDSSKGGDVTMISDSAISFNNVTVNGDTATVGEMQVRTTWEWHYNGTYTDTTDMHTSSAQFQKVSDNTWRWTRNDSPYPDETITITLTSSTTATVEQELNPKHDNDSEVYRLVTSFTITKQNSNPSPTYDCDLHPYEAERNRLQFN